jgi:hypothetical protein
MRNRFIITESEKDRILLLHEQFAGSGEAPDPLLPNTSPKPITPVVAATLNADIVKVLETMKISTPAYATTIGAAINLLNDPKTPQISRTSTPDDILTLITPLFPDPTVLEFVKTAITNAVPEMIFPKATPPVVASTPVQLGVKNPKIVTIQTLLNTKYQSGLVPDGKWGPKTAAAIKAAFDKKGSPKTEPLKTEPPKTEVSTTGGEVKLDTKVAATGGGTGGGGTVSRRASTL